MPVPLAAIQKAPPTNHVRIAADDLYILSPYELQGVSSPHIKINLRIEGRLADVKT